MQLQFAPLNFGLLHFNLGLFLHLGHFDSFGNNLLLHQIGLDIIGFVGGGLLLFHLGIKGGFFQRQVTL